MSAPRAKTPCSDAIKQPPGADSKGATAKKSPTPPTIKSKIPKQDKNSTSTLASEISKNGDNLKPSTPSTPSSSRRSSVVPKIPENSSSSIVTRSSYTKNTPPASMGFGVTPVGGQKRILENQFSTRKNRYIALRQDIVDKQKASEKAFEELIQLREKIVSTGGRDPGRLEDIIPAPSSTSGRPATATIGELGKDGDKDLISSLETHLRQMSGDLLEFCREALSKRTSVLEWLVDFDSKSSEKMPEPLQLKEEIAHQLDTIKTENAEFEERLNTVKQNQLRQADELVQRMRCLWHECQVYKKERETPQPVDLGNSEELMRDLRLEREKFLKARAKLREQEAMVNMSESKLKDAQANITKLETQLKQKEMIIEQKSRELSKFQKSYDNAKKTLEKHNDTVESRVAKLKEELGVKENEAKKMVAEYKKQIQELERDLENGKKAAKEFNETIEKLKLRNSKLEEKCKQLLEMQEKSRADIEQTPEFDVQLYNELKRAKKQLAEKEEIILKLQKEREELLSATDHESESSKEKLTADLLKKTNELQATRNQFVQLQKNYQKMQQRAEHLELRLSDMSRLQAQLKESSGRPYGVQVLQLQQQLSDLRGSLTESNKQNSELEKTCAQLQLKVDRYKRYLRNLEGGMKVRDEARSLLQHNETDPNTNESGETSFNTMVNADEYQQVCSLLESKEMQVMKLEKLVKQMEKQEEYSQTQRTRLESRIAELEFALKEGKLSQRNRGFSFL